MSRKDPSPPGHKLKPQSSAEVQITVIDQGTPPRALENPAEQVNLQKGPVRSYCGGVWTWIDSIFLAVNTKVTKFH